MARALYIHWPFCLKKCPYCDFNSHVRKDVDVKIWENALLTDMRHESRKTTTEPLTSVFFGGGTPSLMPPALVETLLEEAQKLWGFDAKIEITLEANPSSVEASNFSALANAGVNRVSLGIQSLENEALRFLGRLHDVTEALQALEIAQSVFDRVSFDLIYALPGQSPEQWRDQLSQALSYGTSHLSLYQLTIEPNTRFATDVRIGAFEPMDDDRAADLFALTQELTCAAGVPAYEVSNHARPGEKSRHNLTYWRYQDYCGIGPGAHGRRSGMATQRHRKPENWLSAIERNSHGTLEELALGAREMASEALLMGLRLYEGVNLKELSTRLKLPLASLVSEHKIIEMSKLELISGNGSNLSVTPTGMPLLDALLSEIVHDDLVAA